jgi:indole-3-glycerol phosphate synthase
LIAEVKKASPSRGVIRADIDPVTVARIYESEGAACISVLTDERYFQGKLEYLQAIRGVVSLPLLRKDFIIDPYQIVEARAAGADAVLFIAEALQPTELTSLFHCALEWGLTPLVELHDPVHLPRVLDLPAPLIGINNRDLRTFQVDLEHSLRLREKIPPDRLVVSESGIRTRQDLDKLAAAGINAVLVGESLMAAPDIAAAVRALLGRN